jgi:uncharacterized protein (DUF983 family)
MFRTWFSLNLRCSDCGLYFERQEREDYWLGALLLNFIVTELVFAAVLLLVLVATWPEPPWTLVMWAGGALMVVTPILFYPLSKALWLAVDLIFRPAQDADFNPSGDS